MTHNSMTRIKAALPSLLRLLRLRPLVNLAIHRTLQNTEGHRDTHEDTQASTNGIAGERAHTRRSHRHLDPQTEIIRDKKSIYQLARSLALADTP